MSNEQTPSEQRLCARITDQTGGRRNEQVPITQHNTVGARGGHQDAKRGRFRLGFVIVGSEPGDKQREGTEFRQREIDAW